MHERTTPDRSDLTQRYLFRSYKHTWRTHVVLIHVVEVAGPCRLGQRVRKHRGRRRRRSSGGSCSCCCMCYCWWWCVGGGAAAAAGGGGAGGASGWWWVHNVLLALPVLAVTHRVEWLWPEGASEVRALLGGDRWVTHYSTQDTTRRHRKKATVHMTQRGITERKNIDWRRRGASWSSPFAPINAPPDRAIDPPRHQ